MHSQHSQYAEKSHPTLYRQSAVREYSASGTRARSQSTHSSDSLESAKVAREQRQDYEVLADNYAAWADSHLRMVHGAHRSLGDLGGGLGMKGMIAKCRELHKKQVGKDSLIRQMREASSTDGFATVYQRTWYICRDLIENSELLEYWETEHATAKARAENVYQLESLRQSSNSAKSDLRPDSRLLLCTRVAVRPDCKY